MRLLNPLYLIGLLGVVWIAWRMFRNRRTRATLRIPDSATLAAVPRTWTERIARLPSVLRLLALALVLVAMARPQMGDVQRKVTSRGVDIVLAIDVSGSMKARDFEPDRLGAAKAVVKDFIVQRKGDRLAVVIFATTAYTFCPMSMDYQVVQEFVNRIQHEMVDNNRTAIGTGLATALKSLESSEAKSKLVILLTDGVNNSGTILPMQAAEAAKALGVRVYTIGVGTRGTALTPAMDPFTGREVLQQARVDIDEDTLTKIAEMTGGKYYRATETKALYKIYEEIDRLEKSEIEYVEHDNFDEKAGWLILPALAMLLLDLGLGVTRFGKLP